MSKQLDWDAYRYVLDDPTLDRSAFEAHMLADVDLALAVAEALSHVDVLRAASCMAVPAENVQVSTPASHHAAAGGGWQLTSLSALAATLLLAIGLFNYQVAHNRVRTTPRLAEQNLAESWLAIRQTEIVDQSSNLVDASTNFVAVRDEDVVQEPNDLVGTEPAADNDWLMDAAREFYAQGEAG